MASARNNWLTVDLDGLRKLLARRGKAWALFELISNGWDEASSVVRVDLMRPVAGLSVLSVMDDSPNGFRDLADAYTMFGESYKKGLAEKRGVFNLGEKLVLALCEEAMITTTTGRVMFGPDGRKRTRAKTEFGTYFEGSLRLTIQEWEEIGQKMRLLLPEIPTYYNDELIPVRTPIDKFTATLPTVLADQDGVLRPRKRSAVVRVYEPLPGETAAIYEMGIPVVDTGDRWHVSVEQKVPLNMERDNVTPAFLRAVRVAVVNHLGTTLNKETATANWVREAAEDPNVDKTAFRHIITQRFGEQAVVYDPSDVGSNREAASKDYTVVAGGSLSAGEWENVRRTEALKPAGQLFPTDRSSKEPDKRYTRDEWTPAMRAYAAFVEGVSVELVGHKVTLSFIEDKRMVCGQFFGSWYMVNLAHHNVENWQGNIELMLHELAHTVVKSNDHLHHDFYETVGRLGAKLALMIAQRPGVATCLGYLAQPVTEPTAAERAEMGVPVD